MATNGKAWAHGSATHPARVLRNLDALAFGQPWASHANALSATTRGGSYGVAFDGDLAVTTTGGLGYSVAAGRVAGPGTFAAAQGGYCGYNDAAVTGSVTARHATLTREDILAWRARDTDEDATTFEDDGIVLITGTAGSGVPALPSSLGTLVVLCQITVSSAAVNSALVFTDKRVRLSALGAPIICTSGTRPTGVALRIPTRIEETDTGAALAHNGSAWLYRYQPMQSYTPSWAATTSTPAIGNGAISGRYHLVGKRCFLHVQVTVGSTTNGGAGEWSFGLPSGVFGAAGIEQDLMMRLYRSGADNMMGVATIQASSSLMLPRLPTTPTSSVLQQARNTDATTGSGTGIPNFGAGTFPITSGSFITIDGSFETA